MILRIYQKEICTNENTKFLLVFFHMMLLELYVLCNAISIETIIRLLCIRFGILRNNGKNTVIVYKTQIMVLSKVPVINKSSNFFFISLIHY